MKGNVKAQSICDEFCENDRETALLRPVLIRSLDVTFLGFFGFGLHRTGVPESSEKGAKKTLKVVRKLRETQCSGSKTEQAEKKEVWS